MKNLKKKNVTINLTDEECIVLSSRLEEYGISLSDVIENFICDLTWSARSSGSDEERLANEYFERVFYGLEYNLTSFLFDISSVDYFADTLQELEDLQNELENVEMASDERMYIEQDIRMVEDTIEEFKSRFLEEYPYMDWSEEVENFKKFITERNSLLE